MRDDAPDAYAFYFEARRRELSQMPDFAKAAGVRYFEKINPDANESKFWALQFTRSAQRPGGVALLLSWGRIGTEPQSKPFEFIDDDACLRAAAVRAAKKLSEGYREVLPPKTTTNDMRSEQAKEMARQLIRDGQIKVPRASFGLTLSAGLDAIRKDLTGAIDAGAGAGDGYLPPPTDDAGLQIGRRSPDGWALDVRGRAVRPDEERRRRTAAKQIQPTTLGDLIGRFKSDTTPTSPAAPRRRVEARPVAKLVEDRVIDFEE